MISVPYRVLLLVGSGVFMSTMDSSMVNVALPTIMHAYGATLAMTEWVVLVYLLTITVTLLFWGNCSRFIAAPCLYRNGLLVFAVGSLCCTLAPTIGTLIFCRFLQATGGAMMMATGPALIRQTFPGNQLGQGLGLIGIATSLGLMTGPAIAGVLLRWAWWRAIFLITVPVGLIAYLMAGTLLNVSPTCAMTSSRNHCLGGGDRTGAILWTVTVSVTTLLASWGANVKHHLTLTPAVLLLLAAIAALWILFFLHETTHPAPLFPISMLKKRFFTAAILSSMLSFTVLFIVLILMPFYLSIIRHLPPDQVGLVMMTVPMTVFFVAPLAGRLYDRTGARLVATTGLGCCLFATLLLAHLRSETSLVTVSWQLALLGCGQALFLAPNSAAALANVDHDQSALTASLLATARNMGMLLGTSMAGLLFSRTFAAHTGGLDLRDFTPAHTDAFLVSLQTTFLVAACISLIGTVTSWMRGKA